jgi:crotonobetainyl-CoA:carnitine CoA-transferase CaiB-like acyl-CoA transferase
VEAWTLSQNDEALMYKLQTAGVGAGMVFDPVDFLEKNEHIKARQFYKELDHPEIGIIHAPRQPCVLSKTPCNIRRAPLMGEHTDYVLKEFLGMTDEQIAELVVEEVLN